MDLLFRLFSGQSGDALLVLDTNNEKLYILGILHGQFMAPQDWCEGTLYQATVVAPSIKYMQNIMFPEKFTGHLRLMRKDPAANHGVEVADVLDSLYHHE